MTASIFALAKQLAPAVARGFLTLTDADAGLILAGLDHPLSLDPARAAAGHPDVVRGAQHHLRSCLTLEDDRREMTALRIRETVAPLIGRRAPKNALLAEAHGINGAAHFPFAEPEIEEIVRREVWFSLPPAPVVRRHVR